MKAISLLQPWASLVVLGAKRFETRSWGTPFRGPLAVHASKKLDKAALDIANGEPYLEALRYTDDCGERLWLPTGAILGVVEVVAVHRTETLAELWKSYEDGAAEVAWRELQFGDFTPGRWAWELTSPRRFAAPIPCRGALSLWDVPADLLDQINAVS